MIVWMSTDSYARIQHKTKCSSDYSSGHMELLHLSSVVCLPGLKVEGIYRRCGMVTKITQLVEALSQAPKETWLNTDELSVLDVAGALKQFVRQKVVLIPDSNIEHWVKASGTIWIRIP